MHVGILQAYFAEKNPGGGEVHSTELARALKRLGHSVTIFTDTARKGRSDIDDLTVRKYDTSFKVNPLNELQLGRQAASDFGSLDVLVLTDESAWFGVDTAVPTAMIFHLVWHGWISRHGPGWPTLRDKPQAYLYRRLERKIAKKSDAIVSISNNMRQDILRIEDVSAKIWPIPNGVDINRFQPSSCDTEQFTVHYQGRLVEMKNPDLLVKARAQAKTNWKLTIGGDGPLRESLESLVDELDIENSVEFLGFVPDEELPNRYAESDVYVLPSTYEGMPLTVLEAAASGCAVVASPRAATDFVTEDIGRVVEPVPAAIADTIDDLCSKPSMTAELGRRAREKSESYSWDSIARQYETMFQTIR